MDACSLSKLKHWRGSGKCRRHRFWLQHVQTLHACVTWWESHSDGGRASPWAALRETVTWTRVLRKISYRLLWINSHPNVMCENNSLTQRKSIKPVLEAHSGAFACKALEQKGARRCGPVSIHSTCALLRCCHLKTACNFSVQAFISVRWGQK